MQRHDNVIFVRFSTKKLRARSGFTLIEVVISLGIVAFGMVSVMGLLPVGLSTFKQAKTNTVESQIVQGLSNNILLTTFSKLNNLTAQTYSYDMEGKTVTSGGQALYTAKIVLKSMNDSSASPVILQSTNGSAIVDEAYNVQIEITNRTEPLKPHVYSLIIANNNN